MTLGAFVTYMLFGVCSLDIWLWVLFVRTSLSSPRWKPRLRRSLGVLLLALGILIPDAIKLAIWDFQLPDGLIIPTMFLLLVLNTFAGVVGWIAVTRPNK